MGHMLISILLINFIDTKYQVCFDFDFVSCRRQTFIELEINSHPCKCSLSRTLFMRLTIFRKKIRRISVESEK